jgi:vacuolar-type H+-ATPase subunit H
MKTNRTIRIIKGTERSSQASVAQNHETASKSLKPTTREVAGNVANWVNEFRQRRRPDARRAFASLFAEPTSPLSSLS